MALTRLQIRLLVALLNLAEADRPANIQRLALQLDVRRGVVATELGVLDGLGFVHAARVRLSFPGLIVAASARSRLAALSAADLAA